MGSLMSRYTNECWMKMRRSISVIMLCLCVMLWGCVPSGSDRLISNESLPPIYPDYIDVTIPVNIAPLNFLLRDSVKRVEVYINGKRLCRRNGNEVVFSQREWKRLLRENVGRSITVSVRTWQEKQVVEYAPFHWTVVGDSIDPYLTYRLIEPDYEVFNRITLEERCVENFKHRPISDHAHVGNRCMNCHIYGNQNPSLSMFYVRGEGGGAVLNRNGQLSLLQLKADGMPSGSVYFAFHPDGNYLVFSINDIIPAFHSTNSRRLEVYDANSDVYVASLSEQRIFTSPLLCDSASLETFPTFSPDGKSIYFCTAKKVDLPNNLADLQYHLCKISFDKGMIGTRVDTLHVASTSVCHPRISPDGRYILYTTQAYGTFPIWHREADLQLLDLRTGAVDSLDIVNSPLSDTYHSWSSNGRWFVFASKRDDGLYGKPYFCYLDTAGVAHKPFVLPQKDPQFYDNCLKSFNVPELGKGMLPFDATDVARLINGH